MSVEFYNGLDSYPKSESKSAIVTVGTFDGIHLGHQAILNRVRDFARQSNLTPVLVTFHPHPKVIVTPEDIPMLLTSIEEKRQFVPHFFDGNVLILGFNENLMQMSAEEFVSEILVKRLGVSKLIVGYDHAFGKNREGSIPALKLLAEKYKFEIEVVDPVFKKGKAVSSSRIRKAIQSSNYQDALELLGHDYAIYGTVERGIGLGRKLGYPTANVKYSKRKLLPPEGVYACWVQVQGEEFEGMMFIGQNHFNPVQSVSVEANLFNFDRDIYDEEIVVFPTSFVRENRKFESKELLIEQIGKDKQYILELLNKGERQCQ